MDIRDYQLHAWFYCMYVCFQYVDSANVVLEYNHRPSSLTRKTLTWYSDGKDDILEYLDDYYGALVGKVVGKCPIYAQECGGCKDLLKCQYSYFLFIMVYFKHNV